MIKKNTMMAFKIEAELKIGFITACDTNGDTSSRILRELIHAYIELCARAKGRRLPRLDLCGYEEVEGKGGIIPMPLPLRKVAEQRGIYRTGKTEPSKT